MPISGGGYTGPREVTYMFIDAEQLNCTLREIGNEWFGEPIDLDYSALQGAHQKVFYYDCLPARKTNESDAEYESRRSEKTALFSRLRHLRGWHVSEGLARHRRKERQQQKEVDILIAVDVLTHTHRRNMHRMAFLSGDQDFAPLIEAVVREGMYVELIYPVNHTSHDLMSFADVALPMDVEYLLERSTEAFRSRHSLPSRAYEFLTHLSGVTAEEAATLGDKEVALLWRQGVTSYVVLAAERNENGQRLVFRHRNRELLKQYANHHLGDIHWRVLNDELIEVPEDE